VYVPDTGSKERNWVQTGGVAATMTTTATASGIDPIFAGQA